MTSKLRFVVAAAAVSLLASGLPALAQTTTPDSKPKKVAVKHHAHKPATPAADMYLRAAGSEPAPKAAK